MVIKVQCLLLNIATVTIILTDASVTFKCKKYGTINVRTTSDVKKYYRHFYSMICFPTSSNHQCRAPHSTWEQHACACTLLPMRNLRPRVRISCDLRQLDGVGSSTRKLFALRFQSSRGNRRYLSKVRQVSMKLQCDLPPWW